MIAEFEGYKVVTTKFGTLIIWLKNGSTTRLDSWAKYHVDWNALMPVVQRINAINLGGHLFLMGDLQRALCAADIDLVYSAVVAFIQFYNSTKNTSDNE